MRRAALYIRGSCVLNPVDSHVFGQQGKKEYGIDNVKVTNSAWDTNLIATSSVRRLPRTSVQVIGWVLTLAPYSATSVSTGTRPAEARSPSSLSLLPSSLSPMACRTNFRTSFP